MGRIIDNTSRGPILVIFHVIFSPLFLLTGPHRDRVIYYQLLSTKVPERQVDVAGIKR